MPEEKDHVSKKKSFSRTAATAWLQLLKKTLVRYLLDAADLDLSRELAGLEPLLRREIEHWIEQNRRGQLHESGRDLADRAAGGDWPATAETMMGMSRMDNLQTCLLGIVQQKIPGDLAEVGVWRGGLAS